MFKSGRVEEVDVVVGTSTTARKPRLLSSPRMRRFFLALERVVPVWVWIPLSRSRSSSFLFSCSHFCFGKSDQHREIKCIWRCEPRHICLVSTTGYGFSSSCKSSCNMCNLQEKKNLCRHVHRFLLKGWWRRICDCVSTKYMYTHTHLRGSGTLLRIYTAHLFGVVDQLMTCPAVQAKVISRVSSELEVRVRVLNGFGKKFNV